MDTNTHLTPAVTEQKNRRLLELAARAAGITGTYWHGTIPSGVSHEWIEIASTSRMPNNFSQHIWNPLKQMVDAFGLAVVLGLEFKHGDGVLVVSSKEGWASSARQSINPLDPLSPFNFGEYFSSLFLAITEVAAKIQEERESAAAPASASA